MKSLNSIFWPLVLATMVLVSTSCKDDDDPTNTDGNVVTILSNIDNPTTWSGDSIYLIRKFDFYVNNTLTISPGCIIKFHPTEGAGLTLGGTGTLIAQGTAVDPIVFTSFKDDAHGGDTNGDESATSPAPKDWGEINTNGLNGSVFEYCEFYYGGASAYSATLNLDAGSVASVQNCFFVKNAGDDGSGWYGALDASGASYGTVIENNIFYQNTRPLSVAAEFDMGNSNIFHNPDNPSQVNTYNGIFVYAPNDIARNITWQETEVPFIIDDNDLWVESGNVLTLGNGVVLKFRPGSAMVLGDGVSSISNYNGAGVYFTSYKDDNRLGDTNADGTATAPAANDWIGIYDNTLSIPSPYYYTWGNILYDSY